MANFLLGAALIYARITRSAQLILTLVVEVEPEPEPVLPFPRPRVPAPPLLPPRYRSQEASVSSGSGSFVSAEDHMYEPIQQLPNVIRQTGIKIL